MFVGVGEVLRRVAGELQAAGADELHGPLAVVAPAVDQPGQAVEQAGGAAPAGLQTGVLAALAGGVAERQVERLGVAVQLHVEPAQAPVGIDEAQALPRAVALAGLAQHRAPAGQVLLMQVGGQFLAQAAVAHQQAPGAVGPADAATAAGSLADHGELAAFAEQLGQAAAEQRVVIDQQQGGAVHRLSPPGRGPRRAAATRPECPVAGWSSRSGRRRWPGPARA